jgi:transposase
VDEFCRREGIASASFYRWRKLLGMPVGSEEAEQAVGLPLPGGEPGFVDLGTVGVRGSRVELHVELGEVIRVQLVRT